MKKITSTNPISFRCNGTTVLEITKKGVLASDENAILAKSRLGVQIQIEDVSVKESEALAEDALEEAKKEAEKEAKAQAKAEKEAEKEVKAK